VIVVGAYKGAAPESDRPADGQLKRRLRHPFRVGKCSRRWISIIALGPPLARRDWRLTDAIGSLRCSPSR